MNEAHIDRLREMREHYDNEAAGAAALDAAIALMRAAEPLDPKAEREHCDRVVLEKNPLSMTERLMHERAAARAEVEAKYQGKIRDLERAYEYQTRLADDADAAVGDMQDELETARDWIKVLEARRDIDAELLEARAALKAATERIAELDQKLTSSQAWSQEFKTKLAALLQAAERAYKALALDLPARPENREIVEYVRAAIEASKK